MAVVNLFAPVRCHGCGHVMDSDDYIKTRDGQYWHYDCATTVLDVVMPMLGAFTELVDDFAAASDELTAGKTDIARQRLEVTAQKLKNFGQERMLPLIQRWEARQQEVEDDG